VDLEWSENKGMRGEVRAWKQATLDRSFAFVRRVNPRSVKLL